MISACFRHQGQGCPSHTAIWTCGATQIPMYGPVRADLLDLGRVSKTRGFWSRSHEPTGRRAGFSEAPSRLG
eukprot:15448111-Alexandrium_andersonii.AAC.1